MKVVASSAVVFIAVVGIGTGIGIGAYTYTYNPKEIPPPVQVVEVTRVVTATPTTAPTITQVSPTATYPPTHRPTPTRPTRKPTWTPTPTTPVPTATRVHRPILSFRTPTPTTLPPAPPTNTPTPYKVSYTLRYYSAPKFKIMEIPVCFEEHTHYDDGITYTQDAIYNIRYKDRQGRRQLLTLEFEYKRNTKGRYIQLYETMPVGNKETSEYVIAEALRGIKSGKYTQRDARC